MRHNPHDRAAHTFAEVDNAFSAHEGVLAVSAARAADPCEMLWRAVVARAVLDALWCDPTPLLPITRFKKDVDRRTMMSAMMRAQRWLLEDVRDFEDVCLMAGLEPQIVRANAREAIAARPTGAVET